MERIDQCSCAIGFGIIPLGIWYSSERGLRLSFLNGFREPTVRRVYDLFSSLAGNANYYGIEIRHNIASERFSPSTAWFAWSLFLLPSEAGFRKAIGGDLAAGASVRVAILPIAVVLGFSILVQSWFINRYLLICLPALLLIRLKVFSRSAEVARRDCVCRHPHHQFRRTSAILWISAPISGMEECDGLHCGERSTPGTAQCSAWHTGGCYLNLPGQDHPNQSSISISLIPT